MTELNETDFCAIFCRKTRGKRLFTTHLRQMRTSLETLKPSNGFTQSGGLALLQHTITVTLEFGAVSSTAGGPRPYVIQPLGVLSLQGFKRFILSDSGIGTKLVRFQF